MQGVLWRSEPRVFGYCPWAPERVLAALVSEDPPPVPGDFVLVGRTFDGGTLIVTSPLCARPYYWARDAHGEVVHGATVFDVASRGGISWRWNRAALRDVALLEHTLGEQTLHADISRCPAGTVMRFGPDGGVSRRQYYASARLFEHRCGVEEALETFVDVHNEMDDASAFLSLSAGFDSRVLLAALLRRGIAPRCATMGHAASTDVVVARRIANDEGLEHEVVPIDPRDYLRYGARAVEVTSGSKTALHFHTFIYAQKLGLNPNDAHHVGSNGEFARTGFFDAGWMSRALDAVRWPLMHTVGLGRILLRTWRSRIGATRLGRGALRAAHAFAEQATLAGGPLNRLDELMAFQRVRHFIGNGIAMYGTASQVRAPFLDVRWMKAVAGLSREDKLGSNWHRFAIERLRPQLLRYGRDDAEAAIEPRAPALYRLRRGPRVPYAPLQRMLALPEVAQRIIETPTLDELVPRTQREAAVRDRDGPLLGMLLTLHFVTEVLRDRQIPIS